MWGVQLRWSAEWWALGLPEMHGFVLRNIFRYFNNRLINCCRVKPVSPGCILHDVVKADLPEEVLPAFALQLFSQS